MSRLLKEAEVLHFKEMIDSYQPKQDVLREFVASQFAIIAGPSGAGKDTLRNELITTYPNAYQPVLSTTTRPPRQGERNGVDYHFRTLHYVESGLKSKEFLQAALVHDQQISCLDIQEIRKLQPNQTGLSILIVQTEYELVRLKPNLKTIFIIPPNIDVLRERLRQGRPLSKAETERRMKAGVKELQIALETERYYCLVSEDLSLLAKNVHNYLNTNVRILDEDRRARTVIKQILNTLSN
jgi:guanylate kinase